jgi:hypothetical protein
LAEDSSRPVINASLRIRGTYRGTSANYQGFFSLVAKEGDWIDVSSMGFKKIGFQVPYGLKDPSYIQMVYLMYDTIVFAPVNIYPWPSPEKFKDAFVALDLNKIYGNNLYYLIDKNFEEMLKMEIAKDAREYQKVQLDRYSSELSNRGIVPFPGIGTNITFGTTKGYTPKQSDKKPLTW